MASADVSQATQDVAQLGIVSTEQIFLRSWERTKVGICSCTAALDPLAIPWGWLEDQEEAQRCIDKEDDIIPNGFVVAITTTKHRRLHFMGNCGRRPGEHYRSFQMFGDTPLEPHRYDKRCKQCFPEEDRLVTITKPGGMEEESESSGSSTHSSS